MVSDSENNFFADLLGDCFAECEEHLTAVRRNLLTLESYINQQQINRNLLNELFRCFHSLKGLSGMIGAKEAEELAHQMESYLKVLREKQALLKSEGFDALLEGTKALEQAIASYGDQTPQPHNESIIAQLTTLVQEAQPAPQDATAPTPIKLPPQAHEQLAATLGPEMSPWHFIFTPSTTLAERGININIIRQRLQAIGELIHAAPRLTAEGGVIFDLIATIPNDSEPRFSDWKHDGLTWTPYEQETTKPTIPEEHPTPSGRSTSIPSTPSNPPPLESRESLHPAIPPVTPHSQPPLLTQPSNVVRVDLPKLDSLMQMIGDLVISRARLEDQLGRLQGTVPALQLRSLQEINLTLERQLQTLREGVMRVRLVPIAEIFARMQFALRDLVRDTQKQVSLELSGQETEIDKFLVERMMDPLLHLVRNAVSHGIEPEAERLQIGKSAEGTIALRASAIGEMVVIEVEDDGCGIDSEKVLEKARSLGWLTEEEKNPIAATPALILDLLCAPGFSTKEVADLTSGRGIGMAIVKNTVQELGGSLSLEAQVGQGTKFIIRLPLTLAIADALIVTVCGQTFAIPQSAVREVIEVQPQAITPLENNEVLPYRNGVLPLVHLSRLFGLSATKSLPSPLKRQEVGSNELEQWQQEPRTRVQSSESRELKNVLPKYQQQALQSQTQLDSQSERNFKFQTRQNGQVESYLHPRHALVIGSGLKAVGIVVDRVNDQRTIVVRTLTDPLIQVFGIAGATELGDGRVVLILDATALERSAVKFKIKT